MGNSIRPLLPAFSSEPATRDQVLIAPSASHEIIPYQEFGNTIFLSASYGIHPIYFINPPGRKWTRRERGETNNGLPLSIAQKP
jgi:hypothetical protein